MKIIKKAIQKDYKRESDDNVEAVANEHKRIAKDLDISNRVLKTVPREAFVTVKDHKEDFAVNPNVRLINPAKQDLGKVAMKKLDQIVKSVRAHQTHLKQAISTKEVLTWFNSIDSKNKYKFINFNIESFYPSITEELLIKACNWAANFTLISPEDKDAIISASKSFLYCEGKPWVKKGGTEFDIGMGAYHGAQACELVGLFLLHELSTIPGLEAVLYRDDSLGITKARPRQTEKIRQAIINIFKRHNLKITIATGLSRVNFLDVTLDLERGIYKPYRKPGDKPLYVNAASNHPPNVIKNIPLGINRRLVEISSNEEIFNEAAEFYQAELDRCGYNHKLIWLENIASKPKRRRKREVVWFNPPYSMNVKTPVGKEFLKLIDKHFPKGSPLHKFINRNTVKISYRCVPNMGSYLAKHNAKIMKNNLGGPKTMAPNCHCLKSRKQECPLPGACNQMGTIYQAEVNTENCEPEFYIGLAKRFKKRWYTHRDSLMDINFDRHTTLSKYVWKQRGKGLTPKVQWRILERNVADFNPIRGTCRLCTREKYRIVLEPSSATLNKRTELFTPCPHKAAFLIGDPPD